MTEEIEAEWLRVILKGVEHARGYARRFLRKKKLNIDNRIAEDDKYLLILKK